MKEEDYYILIKDIKELLQSVCKDDRIRYHINPVVEIACEMARELNADVQVVEIASYFHDITKMTGKRKEHHLTGAKYAESFLSNYDIEKVKVEMIKDCIKKHRGGTEFTRNTIEEKIVATADAVAHIMHPLTLFYAWYGRRGCSIDEGADGMLQKLEKSWNKIEFQNVKNKMEKRYNMLINMLKEM